MTKVILGCADSAESSDDGDYDMVEDDKLQIRRQSTVDPSGASNRSNGELKIDQEIENQWFRNIRKRPPIWRKAPNGSLPICAQTAEQDNEFRDEIDGSRNGEINFPAEEIPAKARKEASVSVPIWAKIAEQTNQTDRSFPRINDGGRCNKEFKFTTEDMAPKTKKESLALPLCVPNWDQKADQANDHRSKNGSILVQHLYLHIV